MDIPSFTLKSGSIRGRVISVRAELTRETLYVEVGIREPMFPVDPTEETPDLLTAPRHIVKVFPPSLWDSLCGMNYSEKIRAAIVEVQRKLAEIEEFERKAYRAIDSATFDWQE